MPDHAAEGRVPSFRPLVIGALYTGIERGLAADLLAARAHGGTAVSACTAIVVASHGIVTDVLDVPTDSVDAQLEHALTAARPNAVKIGIVGNPHTVAAVFRRMEGFDGPVVHDLTLSGPSGEDLIGPRGLDALLTHLARPDLVTLRRTDAELLTRMEITSLDDAQVAVQRLAHRGARRILLRCGRLPARFFDEKTDLPEFVVDLYYDGEEFALFEAPYVHRGGLHGASSALSMALIANLAVKKEMLDAIQAAKSYVTEAFRHSIYSGEGALLNFFWRTEKIGDLS